MLSISAIKWFVIKVGTLPPKILLRQLYNVSNGLQYFTFASTELHLQALKVYLAFAAHQAESYLDVVSACCKPAYQTWSTVLTLHIEAHSPQVQEQTRNQQIADSLGGQVISMKLHHSLSAANTNQAWFMDASVRNCRVPRTHLEQQKIKSVKIERRTAVLKQVCKDAACWQHWRGCFVVLCRRTRIRQTKHFYHSSHLTIPALVGSGRRVQGQWGCCGTLSQKPISLGLGPDMHKVLGS